MALVALPSPSNTPHKGVTGFGEVRASAILTGSYVASNHVEVGEYSRVAIQLEFTIGSLTTAEVKPQYSDDGGTTWHDIIDESAATTAGVFPVDVLVWQLDATQDAAITFDVTPYESFRVMAKGTGTATSSLLAVSIAAGIRTHDSF